MLFRSGEISITLHDVKLIMGFAINGVKVIGPEISNSDLKVWVLNNYRMTDEEVAEVFVKRYRIHLTKWREFLQRRMNADVAGQDANIIATGYLVELLGSTLFIDKSGTNIHIETFKVLMNMDYVNESSWAAAVLANMYRQLGMASRRNVEIGRAHV